MRVRLILAFLLLALSVGGCAPALARSGLSQATLAPLVRGTETPTPVPTPSLTPPPAPRPTATLFPVETAVAPPAERLPNIALDVELFYSEHWMRVRQVVELENTTSDTWEHVVFNVPIHYVPSAFFLDAATVTQGEAVAADVPPFESITVLRVPLAHPAPPGEHILIEMHYRVVIPPVSNTAWPPTGTTGWRWDLLQAGEWYPALVPYIEGEGWRTWFYHPVGDPTFYPLVNYALTVRADEGITVASGGPVAGLGNYPGLSEDGAWRFRLDGGRGIAFLASDNYQVLIGEADGIPIYSYCLPDHVAAGEAALRIAAESLRLFSALYGPYPYDSLAVVENGFFGGMEYSGLISVTDYAYVTYPGEAPSLLHALVSHEAAHQWWYGAVGNDQTQEPWLDESIAFYSELLYFEHYYPNQVGWWWQKRVDQYKPQGPVDANIYAFDDSATFILLTYGQAARFVRDLRTLMGDQAFFAFLRDYYRTYQWQTVTADDFFAVVRRHTDEDLSPLLWAYFANPDH